MSGWNSAYFIVLFHAWCSTRSFFGITKYKFSNLFSSVKSYWKVFFFWKSVFVFWNQNFEFVSLPHFLKKNWKNSDPKSKSFWYSRWALQCGWRQIRRTKFSGIYTRLGSGCVVKKHSVGYVEFVLGRLKYFFAGAFRSVEFSQKWGGGFLISTKNCRMRFLKESYQSKNCVLKNNFKIACSRSARISFWDRRIRIRRHRKHQNIFFRFNQNSNFISSTKILILY